MSVVPIQKRHIPNAPQDYDLLDRYGWVSCGTTYALSTGKAPDAPWDEGGHMLFTLAVILLIAWLLGVVGTYTIGAFVHVLLVIALVLFLVGLISGRRTVV